ncbi:SGNH/GDSL hydrolase family protein [Cyanobacterium sp. IPPAS B-1200]|uniref:SGNH/GDSL hydrolase family protein n=1 Tax=Cyanobacterium sp. IPPAS B-1200 TaxID=1562720 RepID=UPI000852822E|nr:SGNH/GDSL hydrolase family protein [Cyanobacterium sp. IPPAS B-1200]OEJ78213.1 lipolytic protein G-D-S-L family [Cyanobacterium sp. IPPAS B-1200]
MKVIIYTLVFLIISVILLELFLRIKWGFGNPLIYIADPEIGYLLAPNQLTKRNGHLIYINNYSMRSGNINQDKEKNTFRIMLLGDSIVNGGWWTAQENTLSNLLEQAISLNKSNDNKIEVLNVSANSWGSRNELAYLEKYGTFSSDVLILVLNTDDLFSFAPSSIQVGKALNYPDKKPLLALEEFLKKVLPLPIHPDLINIPKEKGDVVGLNLNAVKNICEIATKNDMDFFLALTPLKREVLPPFSKDYEVKARERLNNFVEELNIKYTDFLPLFQDYSNPENLYHDHIHLSHEGNQLLVNYWQENISVDNK